MAWSILDVQVPSMSPVTREHKSREQWQEDDMMSGLTDHGPRKQGVRRGVEQTMAGNGRRSPLLPESITMRRPIVVRMRIETAGQVEFIFMYILRTPSMYICIERDPSPGSGLVDEGGRDLVEVGFLRPSELIFFSFFHCRSNCLFACCLLLAACCVVACPSFSATPNRPRPP